MNVVETSNGSGTLIFGQSFMPHMKQIFESDFIKKKTFPCRNQCSLRPSNCISYLTGGCASKTRVPQKPHVHFKGNTLGYIKQN